MIGPATPSSTASIADGGAATRTRTAPEVRAASWRAQNASAPAASSRSKRSPSAGPSPVSRSACCRTPGPNPSKRTPRLSPSGPARSVTLVGSSWASRTATTTARTWAPVGRSTVTVALASGSGWSLKVTEVISPSVPSEPTKRRGRSKPATFFTTLPPPLATTPSARTMERPMMRSRAVP